MRTPTHPRLTTAAMAVRSERYARRFRLTSHRAIAAHWLAAAGSSRRNGCYSRAALRGSHAESLRHAAASRARFAELPQ